MIPSKYHAIPYHSTPLDYANLFRIPKSEKLTFIHSSVLFFSDILRKEEKE